MLFAQSKQDINFDGFVDAIFDRHLQDNPSHGTALGFHQYDTKLENYSKTSIRHRRSGVMPRSRSWRNWTAPN